MLVILFLKFISH